MKQIKVDYDWGNNILTIIVNTKTMTLSIEKRVMLHPSQKHCKLDETYSWERRLMDGDEERLYNDILELWHVGEVSPKKLKILSKVYVGMAQLEDNINYLFGIINMNLEKH